MLNMARREILPAVSEFAGKLCETASAKIALSAACGVEITRSYERSLASEISCLTDKAYGLAEELGESVKEAQKLTDNYDIARSYCDKVLPAMATLRAVTDRLERLTDRKLWPVPAYGDILFSVE